MVQETQRPTHTSMVATVELNLTYGNNRGILYKH